MGEIDYIPEENKMKIYEQVENKWQLQPFGWDSNLYVMMPKRPNIWARFWMFIFFGWKFRRIDA